MQTAWLVGAGSGSRGTWEIDCRVGAGVLSGCGKDVEKDRAVSVVNSMELLGLKIVDFLSFFFD